MSVLVCSSIWMRWYVLMGCKKLGRLAMHKRIFRAGDCANPFKSVPNSTSFLSKSSNASMNRQMFGLSGPLSTATKHRLQVLSAPANFRPVSFLFFVFGIDQVDVGRLPLQ